MRRCCRDSALARSVTSWGHCGRASSSSLAVEYWTSAASCASSGGSTTQAGSCVSRTRRGDRRPRALRSAGPFWATRFARSSRRLAPDPRPNAVCSGRSGWDQRPETTSRTTSGTTTTRDTARSVELREEELQARKTPVETGSVQLGKDVVEEERTLDVPVTREEVYVERHPVDRRPADRPIGESETETIGVPVTEERVEVEKQPVVYEEVGVGKRVKQETEQVSDTVRREELRMDNEGEVDGAAAVAGQCKAGASRGRRSATDRSRSPDLSDRGCAAPDSPSTTYESPEDEHANPNFLRKLVSRALE
jgi:uncharacterized protein (TIGR02271 family)